MSSLGISFQKLQVRGLAQDNRQATVSNFPVRAWKKIQYALKTSSVNEVEILRGCDGAIKAGEMLLVLGRPGSGCSTLLKTLAGELHGLKVVSGSNITYHGKPLRSSNVIRRNVLRQEQDLLNQIVHTWQKQMFISLP